MMSRIILALLMGLYSIGVLANNSSDNEPALLGIIEQAKKAASELDYSGIYTYQQGLKIKASRIVHIVDATGERERIQTLDGVHNEYIRHNQDGKSLVPSVKMIIKEHKRAYKFPHLLKHYDHNIDQNYSLIDNKETSRVAGRDCKLIKIQPNDNNRYGYAICIDGKTGMLLQTQTINSNKDVVDQLMFVNLSLGKDAANFSTDPSWDIEKWDVTELNLLSVDLHSQGWRIQYPVGFDIVTQISRQISPDKQVSHLVLSDGLAAISIFVEPFNKNLHTVNMQGGLNKGYVNLYRKRVSDFWVTILGQVPAQTVRSIGEKIEYVPIN